MNPHKEFLLKDCSAIILAGGKSRRMKTDKKTIEVRGVSLLNRAVSNLSGLFTDTLLTVSGDMQDEIDGIRIVPEDSPITAVYGRIGAL